MSCSHVWSWNTTDGAWSRIEPYWSPIKTFTTSGKTMLKEESIYLLLRLSPSPLSKTIFNSLCISRVSTTTCSTVTSEGRSSIHLNMSFGAKRNKTCQCMGFQIVSKITQHQRKISIMGLRSIQKKNTDCARKINTKRYHRLLAAILQWAAAILTMMMRSTSGTMKYKTPYLHICTLEMKIKM